MATQLVLGPRRKPNRRPIRWSQASEERRGRIAHTNGAVERPQLILAEPGSPRSRRITGGLTVLGHLGFLAALVAAAALAPPELIDQVIPVELVPLPDTPLELPGSNLEPAPVGPKQVGAQRANAAQLAASQILAPSQASAMRREALDAARRAIAELNLGSVNEFASQPSSVERSALQAKALTAQDTQSADRPRAYQAQDVSAVRVQPEEFDVISPSLGGPQSIEALNPIDLGVPTTPRPLDRTAEIPDTGGTFDPQALSAAGLSAGEALAIRVDTGIGAGGRPGTGPETSGLAGAGGTGRFDGSSSGTGSGSDGRGEAQGVVRCLESRPVQQYLETVQRRTRERWIIPPEIPENAEVVLRFALDGTGTAQDVRGGSQDHADLALSARQALLTASPFPPLVDANRCLIDKRIVLTFTVPGH